MDMRTARDWFSKAAQEGHLPSIYLLARMYEAGWGLPPDYEKALYWYRKAAELGDEKAPQKVAELERYLN
jgi:TPR repeat protein